MRYTQNTLTQESLIQQSAFILSKKRDFISIKSLCRYANAIQYFGWFERHLVDKTLSELGAIKVNRNVYDVSNIDTPFNYLDMTEAGSYVYVISNGENFKIGFSKNPHKRIKALQTGTPKELKLICLFNHVGEIFEKYLHYKFKNYKVKNEWYEISDEIIDYIKTEADYKIENL